MKVLLSFGDDEQCVEELCSHDAKVQEAKRTGCCVNAGSQAEVSMGVDLHRYRAFVSTGCTSIAHVKADNSSCHTSTIRSVLNHCMLKRGTFYTFT